MSTMLSKMEIGVYIVTDPVTPPRNLAFAMAAMLLVAGGLAPCDPREGNGAP